MALSARKYVTQNFLELSVGSSFMVEIIIHMRSTDLDWWNKEVSKHEAELMTVISRKIISQEEVFRNEILGANDKCGASKQVIIGEKNLASTGKTDGKKNESKKTSTGKSGKKSKRKHQAPIEVASKIQSKENLHKRPSIVFGDSIQVMYKIECCESINSATLFFHDTEDMENNIKAGKNKKKRLTPASFGQLNRLSHRIIVWCFKYDPENPTAAIPSDGGFPRPEMIPLTLLFK